MGNRVIGGDGMYIKESALQAAVNLIRSLDFDALSEQQKADAYTFIHECIERTRKQIEVNEKLRKTVAEKRKFDKNYGRSKK